MKHMFDVELAIKVGINASIILENIAFWVKQNESNGTNLYDGKYWTYNSKKAYHEMFPYLSEKQIAHALKNLIEEGYIVTGRYSKNACDRTLYYALTDKGKSIVH